MTYGRALDRFAVLVQNRIKGTLAGVASAVHESIVDGSPLTGAPGQPVDEGTLKNSWQNVIAPDSLSAVVGTNVVYAPDIEAGMRVARTGQVTGQTAQRLTQRSAVGGFHSVKLTIAGADALQADVVRGLGGGR